MKLPLALRRVVHRADRGFAVVSALFILVVLSALGGFIVSISSQQQIGSALDVQGVRAYEAARSGLEWGLYQAGATASYNFSYGTPAVAVNTASPNVRACPASPSSFSPAAPTLSAYTVTVTCSSTVDAGGGPTAYSFTSIACNQPSGGSCPNLSPGNNYVERRIDVAF